MKLTAEQATDYKVLIEGRETFKNQYKRIEFGKPATIRLSILMLDELCSMYMQERCYMTSGEERLVKSILIEHKYI